MGQSALRIAFYGKGGIGKSTIASNISVAIARTGRKVLHIGCDPKADSGRSLYRGAVPTVLDALDSSDQPLVESDIVFWGTHGIACVEAGGPHAGAGCAGLGITATMGELERLGVLQRDWDIIIFDVLGDVVCGGFAMPMRKHFTDLVYVVTSSDFMSLYAANNILCGVERYSTSEPMLGGIIENRVDSARGRSEAELFCARTSSPFLGGVPEDAEIGRADYLALPVIDTAPESAGARSLMQIANDLVSRREGVMPRPLSPDELDYFRIEMARPKEQTDA